MHIFLTFNNLISFRMDKLLCKGIHLFFHLIDSVVKYPVLIPACQA